MRAFQHEKNNAIFTTAVFVSLLLVILLLSFLPASPAQAQSTKAYYISTTATGGDCAAIGTWNPATKTCTLAQDLSFSGANGIVVNSNGITIDGNHHTLTGDLASFKSGVSLSIKNNVIIRNLNISNFHYGVYFLNSSNNKIVNNNFLGNTVQAHVLGGSGNAFDLPATGGNYWSNFDDSAEGCDDFNGDYVCDAIYVFSGGQDNVPWKFVDGWTLTPPPDTTPPTVTNVLPAGTIGTSVTTVSVDYSDPGTGIDEAAIVVDVDGSPLAGCTITQTNTSCPVTGLTLGAHAIGGTVYDNAGNPAPVSGSFTFVDSTLPTVSSLQPSGTISSSNATLTADLSDGNGSGINTATVSVTLDGSPVSGCSVTPNSVSCTVTGLGEGAHGFTVSANDMAGNSGTGNGSFIVDSVVPAVSSVQPSGNITTSSTLVSIGYSDGGSGINTGSVLVTLDGVPLAGCAVSATNASCPVTNLALGVHSIGGSVSDNVGNVSPISGNFTFVDFTAPVLTNLQPTGVINVTDTNLTADYSDGGSGINTASVTVTLDGSPISGCTITTSKATCAVTALTEGGHTMSVSVDDKAGNNTSASKSFTVDTAAPTITPTVYLSSSPTGGDCTKVGTWNSVTKTCTLGSDLNFESNGFIIVSNGITLDGNGYNISGMGGFTTGISLSIKSNITIKNLTISDFRYGLNFNSASNVLVYNNNFIGNTTQANVIGGSGNVFSTPLPDGGNYWSNFDTPAEGCNDAGGDGFCDAPYIFNGGQDDLPWTGPKQVVDTTPPTVYNMNPSGDVSTDAPALSANYADSGGAGIDSASVVVTLDSNPVSGCTATAAGVSCPTSGLTQGAHNFAVSVSDNQANTGNGNGNFSVDTLSPAVTSVAPSGVVSTDYTTISVDYFDGGAGIDPASVSITMDGSSLSGCTISTTNASCDVTGLSTSLHTIGGSVADNAGNTSPISGSFDVVAADTTPPTITNLQPTGTINTSSTAISADYSDGNSGIDTASVVVTLDGSPVSGCVAGASSVSCPVSGLGEGSHAFAVSVDDNQANTGTANGSFTVDMTSPVVTNVAPSGTVAASNATISANFSDALSGINTGSVIVSLDGGTLGGCTVTATSVSCPVAGLTFGTHTIGGSVSDNVGNTASITGSFTYADTTPPAIANMTPTGTVGSSDITLAADYSDSGSGVNASSVAVELDGAPVSGCTAAASHVSCNVTGVADGSHTFTVLVDDNLGNTGNKSQSFTVDTAVAVNVPTIYITTSSTGGDCTTVGTWDAATKTCTLTNNLKFTGTNGIVVSSNGVTIDGDGYAIIGTGGNTTGITMTVKTGTTIKNATINNFRYGLYMLSSSNTTVYFNNFVDNVIQAYVIGGSGNSFNQPLPAGGNYWSNYDTPAEGCDDTDSNFVCDSAYTFVGGMDNLPWSAIRQAVDTLPPSITNMQPAGAIATTSTTLSASYSDAGTGVDVATVQVTLDGSPVSGCTITASSASCPVSGLTEGSHSFSVAVSDLGGNAGSTSSPFDVDLTSPTVSAVLPTGTVTSDATTINALYNDSGSGVDASAVTLTLDGNPLSGCTVTGTSASCDVYGLANGPHTIGGSVADMAGNSAPISGSFDVSIIDTTPPEIVNLQPSGTIITTSTIISADYSDSGDGIDTASVAVTLDGSPTSGCTVGAANVSCAVSGVGEGFHIYSISIDDLAGNNANLNGSFTVDSLAPTVTSITPSGTITVNAATIAVYYSDSGSGVYTGSVAVKLDGSPLSGCTVTASSASCDVYGIADGTHTVDVTLADNAGNSGSGNGSFTVTTGGPEITSVSPTGFIGTADATIQGYFNDTSGSGIDSASAAVYLDGTGYLSGCTATATGISCPVSGLMDGPYTYTVSVSNNAGTSASAGGSFTVDTTGPAILSVSPVGWQNTDSATIVAYYQDLLSGIDTNAVMIAVDGVQLTGCTVTTASATCDVTGLTEGDHVVDVHVADNVGNTSLDGTLIRVDLTPPVVSNLSPTGTTNRTSFTVQANLSDNLTGVNAASVAVYMDGNLLSGCSAAGTIVICPARNVADGSHLLEVYADDGVGNMGYGSGTVTVDSSVPPVDATTATINLSTSFTGGDCTKVGIWDSGTKTCELVTSLDVATSVNGIAFANDGITLDGSGYSITSGGGNATGVSMSIRNNITVRNLNISAFNFGVYVLSSNNTTVYHNNFEGNTTQITATGGAGNVYNLPMPDGGNYFSDYDTPAEGCDDPTGDGVCDAPYVFTGGQDDAPWTVAGGWSAPLPGDTTTPAITNILPTGTINTVDTTISAFYSDAGSGVDSASVVAYLDGSPVSGCSVTSSDVSCGVTGLADGAHSIMVEVADNDGNVGQGSGSVTVDATTPLIMGITPSGLINTTDATIKIYYDDVTSGIDTAAINITLDGAVLTGCTVTATDASCNVYTLTEGIHHIGGTVADNAGNTSPISGSFDTDTVAPVVYPVAPTGPTSDSGPMITGGYDDIAGSGIDTASVVISVDGIPLTGCTVDTVSFNCPTIGLGEGAHFVDVSVGDIAGNTGTTSGTFLVDTTMPVITSVSPSGFINTADATVKVYYDETGSGMEPTSTWVTVDGLTVSGCTLTATDASCNVYGLSEGPHAIGGHVSDAAGNAVLINGSFDVDTIAPSVFVSYPPALITESNPTITADYGDLGSGVDTSMLSVMLDSSDITASCAIGPSTVSCATSGLGEGTHALSVSVDDLSSNNGVTNTNFFIDGTAPSVTSVLPSGIISTANATVKVYYDDGAGSGIDTTSVNVTVDGSAVSGCTVTAADASCNAYSLADGTHTIGGSVADVAGNVSAISGSFTVSTGPPPDTTPPVVTSVTPGGTITNANAVIEVYYNDGSGDGIDATSVSVTLDGSPLSGCNITTAYASCAVYGLSAGAHNIGGSVLDLAANSTPISGGFTYTPPSCNATYTDINGAAYTVYSDPGYSAALCQYDQLSPNTDYYLQVKDPSTNLSGNGTDNNYLRIYDLSSDPSQVSFGNGSNQLSFSQQGSSASYTYRVTFRTPSVAGVYNLYARISDDSSNQTRLRYTTIRVGNNGYVKLFSDAGYTNQTDTFGAADTVYMEIYSPALSSSSIGTSSYTTPYDFHYNSSSNISASSASRPADNTYRVAFQLNGTSGDKLLRTYLRNSGGSTFSQIGVPVHIQ